MATKIKGFLAGTSYAPYVSTAEALLRRGCEAINNAKVGSALVVLEDGTIWVGHPIYRLDQVTPDTIAGIIRERLVQDDFATRPIRSAIRQQLRELEGKTPKEQMTMLSKILKEHAEHFLVPAGTDMDEAQLRREAELDARCMEKAA